MAKTPRRPAKPTDRPTVFVIAGPNGAGKTTFATEFLPHFVQCREFLNADLTAAGLAPFAPGTQDVRAGRLLLERVEELARQGTAFGFETTLAGRGHVRLLRKLGARGYRRVLFFIWLPTADLALRRVAIRVSQAAMRSLTLSCGAVMRLDSPICFGCICRGRTNGACTMDALGLRSVSRTAKMVNCGCATSFSMTWFAVRRSCSNETDPKAR